MNNKEINLIRDEIIFERDEFKKIKSLILQPFNKEYLINSWNIHTPSEHTISRILNFFTKTHY